MKSSQRAGYQSEDFRSRAETICRRRMAPVRVLNGRRCVMERDGFMITASQDHGDILRSLFPRSEGQDLNVVREAGTNDVRGYIRDQTPFVLRHVASS